MMDGSHIVGPETLYLRGPSLKIKKKQLEN